MYNNNFTVEDFKEVVSDMMSRYKPNKEVVVHTGDEGLRVINRTVTANFYLEMVGFLRITKAEKARLKDMINSPDDESLELAGMIIKQLNANSKCQSFSKARITTMKV